MATASEAPLPRRYLEDRTVFRSAPGIGSCGFLHKPGPGMAYRDRVTREFVIVYVLRGRGTYLDARHREQPVFAGCAILMPGEKAHSVVQEPDGRWTECYVSFDNAFAGSLVALGVMDADSPVIEPGLDLGIVERFEQIYQEIDTGREATQRRALARVHELIVTLVELDRGRRTPDAASRLVESACAMLSQDLDARADVEAIAARFDISYERFRKIFRQHVGLAPGEYRIRRRIDRAKTLIAQHRMSNKQVAYALGYQDPFTFSKQFKQVVGVSPQVFRRTV